MAVQDTFRTYTGNGSTTDYAIPFTYEITGEVQVKLNGVVTTAYTFVNPSLLRMNTAPVNGAVLTVERVTNIDSPAVVWKNGSGTTGSQLNAMVRQLINAMQEARDTALRGLFRLATGEYDFQNARGTNVATPINPSDIVPKSYVDGLVGAVDVAVQAKNAAESARDAADTAATNAGNQKELARKYAENGFGVAVVTGEFSAKHWATVAQGVANSSASGLSVVPTGNIASTNVQSALAELDSEKAPISHDHDSRYYTESEVDTLLSAKAASNAVLLKSNNLNDVSDTAQARSNLSLGLFKKTELIDLTGLSQVDITAPAGAVRCRLTFDAHASTASASISLRVSTDGSTFLAGAAHYSNASLTSNSGPQTVAAGSAVNATAFAISAPTDNISVPVTGMALLSLVRPSTTRLFSYICQSHAYDSTNGMRYFVFNSYVQSAATSDLTIQKLRFFTTAGTWVSGTLQVEWF